ncbi:Carboxypeptidase C [Nostoc flagelliforme CCNUN1]|uniref:Carboxypeptidase C n=1 Tax=Nostoc flagelliforme CCNUN1 TaxID=2038116 RepID=A0A2K8SZU4_9NOSO|nr:Carboxypeptidase C [Nostoc flagelliforme CCNUN1]
MVGELTLKAKQLERLGVGSIHFWKKHNSGTPKTLLYSSSKKVDPPKVDAPTE